MGQHLSETVSSLAPLPPDPPSTAGPWRREEEGQSRATWDGNEMYLFTTYLRDSRLSRLPLCMTSLC